MSATVSFSSTITNTLSIDDADSYVVSSAIAPVDCVFNVKADLNGVFGTKYGRNGIHMPRNATNTATIPEQDSVSDFTPVNMDTLRERMTPLLVHQSQLTSGTSATHGADITYFSQMKTQLMNLFDNMSLSTIGSNGVEGPARIGDGSVRMRDTKVTDFLTVDNVTVENMVSKTFLSQQLGQLLEAAARDASRYEAKGSTGVDYHHVLKLHEGDRLCCRINVQAKSSTHGTEPYVNKQIWIVEFEQDSTLDHSALYPALLTPLPIVISSLNFSVNTAAFLTGSKFTLAFDFRDMYSSATGSFIGWSTYKLIIIASSGGILTNASTDAEVEAFIFTGLQAQYQNNMSGTVDNTVLHYLDPEHYLMEIDLPVGSKPYFKGIVQNTLADVQWRLSYCSVAHDSTSVYSTILSGTKTNNQLQVVPVDPTSVYGVEFPVSGINNVRDGIKLHYSNFSVIV